MVAGLLGKCNNKCKENPILLSEADFLFQPIRNQKVGTFKPFDINMEGKL
jgi:hypothetical protein